MFGRHQRETEDRPRTSGGLAPAIAAAREQLGLEIVCVSRAVRAGDLGELSADPAAFDPLPDGAAIIPLESGDGRLHGSLVCRPVGRDRRLDERDLGFLRVLGRIVGSQIERSERERARVREQAEASGLQALLAAIEARDAYTGEHSRSVVDLSVRVAEELRLASREIEQLEQVALLHDVGKVAIPDHVLQKAGPLSDDEFELVRTHPVVGARIVSSVSDLAHLAPAIRSGHERWDGLGYPDGLAGDEIPIPSRITFVCDAYDAMISHRPYRPALPPKIAHEEVRRNAGSQFDPRAAEALLHVLERPRPPARARATRPTAPPV